MLGPQVVERAHLDPTSAHGGMAEKLAILRHLYWPGMTIQVKEFVRGCEMCKDTTAPNFRMHVGIGRRVKTERPFSQWSRMDIYRSGLFLEILFPEGDKELQVLCHGNGTFGQWKTVDM